MVYEQGSNVLSFVFQKEYLGLEDSLKEVVLELGILIRKIL